MSIQMTYYSKGKLYIKYSETALVYSADIPRERMMELHRKSTWWNYFNSLMGTRTEHYFFGVKPENQFYVSVSELDLTNLEVDWNATFNFAKFSLRCHVTKLFTGFCYVNEYEKLKL